MYTLDGGQPGHRAAWTDDVCNALTSHFFRDTLLTLDEAFLRPRYAGYIHFQDEAGVIVHRWLEQGGDLSPVIEKIDALYRETLTHA
jgi:multiple sugar transport system substrate-binding protein